MTQTEQIIKHLNALISKYQLEIDLLIEMYKKPTNELHQAEIDINISYFEEEIKEIKDLVEYISELPYFKFLDVSEGENNSLLDSNEDAKLNYINSIGNIQKEDFERAMNKISIIPQITKMISNNNEMEVKQIFIDYLSQNGFSNESAVLYVNNLLKTPDEPTDLKFSSILKIIKFTLNLKK